MSAPFCQMNHLCDVPALDFRQIFKLLHRLLEKRHLLEEWYVANRRLCIMASRNGLNMYPVKTLLRVHNAVSGTIVTEAKRGQPGLSDCSLESTTGNMIPKRPPLTAVLSAELESASGFDRATSSIKLKLL